MSTHDSTHDGSYDGSYDSTVAQDPEVPRDQRQVPPPRRRRPPVDVGHLVMGVAFVGLTIVWALIQFDVVELEEARWLLPLPWLAAGAAGLIASIFRRRDPAPDSPDWKQDWKQDWKRDQRDWKAQFKADQRAYKEQVRRSHQAMKQDIKRHVQDWKHGGPGGHGH